MNASLKLHRAGRAFLLRLVAENGPAEACRILREIAAEIEELQSEEGPTNNGMTYA